MSELLPLIQARNVRRGLVDYLTTTFALTDPEARDGLDRFLSDPETGMFKGPYVRLRLPFRPADEGWRESLEWYEGFPPYGHQAGRIEAQTWLAVHRKEWTSLACVAPQLTTIDFTLAELIIANSTAHSRS